MCIRDRAHITAIDDVIPEADETITANLSLIGKPFARIGQDRQTVITIAQNDVSEIGITPSAITLSEGSTATLTVHTSTTPAHNIHLDVDFDSDDIVLKPSALVLRAGVRTAEAIITAVDDLWAEPQEKITAVLQLSDGQEGVLAVIDENNNCLLYTSPSPRDRQKSRMPSSA